MENWLFTDPPNVAVVTTRSIIDEGHLIVLVTHDADDGAWQFLDGDPESITESEARLVSLRSMVERDSTLLELGNLPLGWRAWRDGPNVAWQRAPQV